MLYHTFQDQGDTMYIGEGEIHATPSGSPAKLPIRVGITALSTAQARYLVAIPPIFISSALYAPSVTDSEYHRFL